MKIDKKQIAALIQQPSESLQVELKTWLDPRTNEGIAKIVKAIFAIRNRNGGYLIIGFNDETCLPDSYSLDTKVQKLYHIDKIQGLVSRYANNPFEISVFLQEREKQPYPIIVVPEGVRLPVIVKRDLIGKKDKKLLQEGDIYFRTLKSNGTPSSARILPRDFPELLEICFENREADIGRFLRRHLPGADSHTVEMLLGTDHTHPMRSLRERAVAVIKEGTECAIAAADHRGVAADLMRLKNALTLRVGLVLDPVKSDELPTNEFMNKISASNPHYTGWPIWQDSRTFIEIADRPIVSDGVWQALIVQLDGVWHQHFDFMRFDPKGEFYLQRVMQDDLSENVTFGAAMDVMLMIYRVAEVLAVGVSISRNLGWDSDAVAGFAFRWSGLKGRKLMSWVNRIHSIGPLGYQSHSAVAESFVRVPLDIPHSALAPHVELVVGPLFTSFDGYTPSPRLIETCVRKMIERKMDS